MDYKEYLKLESRPILSNYYDMTKYTNHGMSMGHAVLGLVGETIEALLSEENEFARELGDCAWYLAQLLKERFGDEMRESYGVYDTKDLLLCAMNISEYWKKATYYEEVQFDNDDWEVLLEDYAHAWTSVVHHKTTYSVDDILLKNVEKLSKRYPDKFKREK